MRLKDLIETICVHVSIICSLALIAVHILDWYNPFMDFSGHAGFVLYTLCVVSLLRGVLFLCTDRNVTSKRRTLLGRRSSL